jgi:hypothetical protein
VGGPVTVVMAVRDFNTDAEVARFAKAFLDDRVDTFKKDIAICLTVQNKSHAYFPALITCIAFADLLSGLNAGKLERHGLKELKNYVWQFIDPGARNADYSNLLTSVWRIVATAIASSK